MDEQTSNSTISTTEQAKQPINHGSQKKASFWSKFAKATTTTYSLGGKIIKALLSLFFVLTFVGLMFGDSNTKEYQVLNGTDVNNQIAVVELSGTIMQMSSDGNPFSDTAIISPDKLQSTFELMTGNQNLKGIILRINSPGGSVTASDDVYQIIKLYRQKLNVPIWAVYGEVAASGGYYISLGADKIFAHPTTLTGSIGVILQTINISQLVDKYGVQSVTIKSGENKNLLDPFEPVKENQVLLLQEAVDEAFELFVARISESRSNMDQWTEATDGRILTGKQALKYGLIDELASYNEVINKMRNEINSKEAQIIIYGKKTFLESLLTSVASKLKLSSINIELLPKSELNGIPLYLYLK